MKSTNINNTSQLFSRTKRYAFILDAYLSRLDLLKNSIEALDSKAVFNYELTPWTYYDTTTTGYLIFNITLPASIDTAETMVMHYSLYNMKYLGIYSVGEVLDPLDTDITDSSLPFWWAYDATDIYLYIPTFGSTEEKYSFWLPNAYADEEYNIFFNRAHTFYLDYKV
jgi:hypothetical protein